MDDAQCISRDCGRMTVGTSDPAICDLLAGAPSSGPDRAVSDPLRA